MARSLTMLRTYQKELVTRKPPAVHCVTHGNREVKAPERPAADVPAPGWHLPVFVAMFTSIVSLWSTESYEGKLNFAAGAEEGSFERLCDGCTCMSQPGHHMVEIMEGRGPWKRL